MKMKDKLYQNEERELRTQWQLTKQRVLQGGRLKQ